MCGIAGFYDFNGDGQTLQRSLEVMCAAMYHRGPDEGGMHLEPGLGAGLGVRRLGIVDPRHGSQPLSNEDRSVVVVCNGEIYNHRELRTGLETRGHRLNSHSDCEVIAHLYEERGIDFLGQLNGMFALALLDRHRGRLLLARDPVGMKQLYWARTEQGIAFASEARALFTAGFIDPRPDWEMLGAYFSFGWVPSPGTAFAGLNRLERGTRLVADQNGMGVERYRVPRFRLPEEERSLGEYSSELGRLLESSVATHLDADVPAGLFLSGGWDSSLVSLYAARRSEKPLDSYSLVFPDDPDSDEARFSRQVSRLIGSRHHEVEVRDADVLEALNPTSLALEEPVTTAPTQLEYILSRTAGQSLKMVLGGEGSDELFAGYGRFANSPLHRLRRALPSFLFPDFVARFLPGRWGRAWRFMSAADDEQAHQQLLSLYTAESAAPLLRSGFGQGGPASPALDSRTRDSYRDHLDLRLAVELAGRLADGILFAIDKTSMAHSLEVRMPFLDQGVVGFAHRLPSAFKVDGTQMKAVMEPLARELPADIARRAKQGLHVPPRIYRSATLRNYYAETILQTSLDSGLFHHRRLERWVGRRTAHAGPAAQLWPLCHFCLWWNNFIGPSARWRTAAGAPGELR